MKMNKRYYNSINGNMIQKNETKYGNVELYQLQDYPSLYNAYIPKGYFTFWSNDGSDTYKLLVEKSLYERVPRLYSAEVTECWLKFYNEVADQKKKWTLKVFVPISIFALIAIGIISWVVPKGETLIPTIIVMSLFVIMYIMLRKKIDKTIMDARNQTVEDIKNLLGEEEFAHLTEEQQKGMKDFYDKQREELGIANEEEPAFETEEETEVALESTENVENEEVKK